MPPTVQTPITPTGFVTNLANPGAVTAKYISPEGKNSRWFQARLVTKTGEQVKITPIGSLITKTIATNGTVSFTWAESVLGKLPQGEELYLEVRAIGVSPDAWGDWSPGRLLRTNAAPNIPTSLSPATGYASASRPKLSCACLDPNAFENPPGSLTVYAEVMQDDGATVRYRRTMPWNSATERYEYQITSSDEPEFRTFDWKTVAFDGSLYSGGVETLVEASRSAAQTVVYAAAPVVTITGPSSPVSIMGPTVSWTVSDQGRYMVTVTLADGRVAYRYAKTNTTDRTHVIGSAGWGITNGWRNGESVTITVEVTSSAGVIGSSYTTLLLQYTKPGAATGFGAVPITLPGTRGPNGVEVSWLVSTIPTGSFNDYLISRQELSGPGGGLVSGTLIYLESVVDRNELELRDYSVESGQWYRYGIIQREKAGADVLWSDPVTFDQMVQWNGIVLHMPFSPEGYCVGLAYGAPGGSWEPSAAYGKRINLQRTLGRKKRVATIAKSSEITAEHTFGLLMDSETGVGADAQRDRILKIWNAQDAGPDDRPHCVCWRDGFGGRESVLFGVFAEPPRIQRHGSTRTWIAELALEDVDVTLGVEP